MGKYVLRLEIRVGIHVVRERYKEGKSLNYRSVDNWICDRKYSIKFPIRRFFLAAVAK